MTTGTQEHGRMQRAAHALKAYFERKLQLSLELLSEAPADISDADVRFSLTMSQHGLWGVRAPKPLKQEQQTDIYNTFQSVLGGVDILEDKRSEAVRMEAKMNELIGELPSNVIPLRRLAPVPAPKHAKDRHWILKQDCLIESPHVSEVHKMAMELHAHSRRYAFVEFRDLDARSRTRVEELLSLGSITLFIADLTQLAADEQAALLKLMAVDSQVRPLVMAGSALPYPELRCVAGVDLDLLIRLSRAYIKLTRPFSEYKVQGLIHYFLDSLSENPS